MIDNVTVVVTLPAPVLVAAGPPAQVTVAAGMASAAVTATLPAPVQMTYAAKQGLAGPPGDQGVQGNQGVPGDPGPPGPPGGGTYLFAQSTPAAVWTIAHNLQRYPSVTTVDSSGDIVEGDVVYVDANTVRVTFSAPFAGDAYLN